MLLSADGERGREPLWRVNLRYCPPGLWEMLPEYHEMGVEDGYGAGYVVYLRGEGSKQEVGELQCRYDEALLKWVA